MKAAGAIFFGGILLVVSGQDQNATGFGMFLIFMAGFVALVVKAAES